MVEQNLEKSEKSFETVRSSYQILNEDDNTKKSPIFKGLVNVVVDQTEISFTNGTTGECNYRGYSLEDLFENSCFEEVSFLLLFGRMPNQFEYSAYKESLVRERNIPDRILMILKSFPRNTTRIELMRTAISALSLYDEDDYDYSEPANLRKAVRIIAKIPTILAFSHRIQSNLPLVEPSKDLSHAANFLYMLTGDIPDPKIEDIFDKLLICHAEHDLNASTFAARVTVSTLSDIYSAVVSAIGTLRGPLHGGANEKVIRYFLEEIKIPDNVIPWAKSKLEKKDKVMGFGHRIYKTYDPRGVLLKPYAKYYWDIYTQVHPDYPNYFNMAMQLENYIKNQKGLNPNVDFISAILMYAIGIDPNLYTPIFAVSRCAGWISHAIEQIANNKLIRPRLRYIGEMDKKYCPLAER